MQTFQGVFPALVTPFTADGRVNLTVMGELVEFLIGQGISGLYVNGSTGEGAFLTPDERQMTVETVAARGRGRIPFIVHVGASSITDAVALARHARDHGAAGVSSILPPVLYDPRGITLFYEAIAGAVPELPFFPYLFGGTRDAVALVRELAHIPNLGGTKYTGPNIYELNQLVALKDRDWTIFNGMDEEALFGLMFGARGVIGSTVNVMAPAYVLLYRCAQAGDYAEALTMQKAVNKVIRVLLDFGLAGALKQALGLMGFECGQPRVPNPAFDLARLPAFRAALDEAGWGTLKA